MGCKLGRMRRVAGTSEAQQADGAQGRIERVAVLNEGLQSVEAHRRRERVFTTSGGRQADETHEQGRTERVEQGEGSQVEEAQQLGRMERLADPDEMRQGQEEQERSVAWAQRAEEIEEVSELVATEMAIRRMRQLLPEVETRLSNRRERELHDRVETIRTLISVLEQRFGRTNDRFRIIAQGEVSQVLQDETVNDSSRRGALPASRTAVDGLPFISIQQQQLDDGDASCAVCLEVLAYGEAAKQLPCLHIYHDSCILRWLQSRNSCPVCRHELSNR